MNQSMCAPQLVPLYLHHVRYPKGDLLGQFLTWVLILPVYIDPLLVFDFVHRREIHSLLVFIGQQLFNAICLLMKTSIKQRRPPTCTALETCDSYGWPSHHAALAFFHAVYFTLLSFRRNKKRKWLVATVTWSLALLTMHSRAYLGYHSVSQVIGGTVVGSCVSAVWFLVVNSVLSGYFPAIEESWIGRMLYIKDTSHLENVLKFEYDDARARRRYMHRKSN